MIGHPMGQDRKSSQRIWGLGKILMESPFKDVSNLQSWVKALSQLPVQKEPWILRSEIPNEQPYLPRNIWHHSIDLVQSYTLYIVALIWIKIWMIIITGEAENWKTLKKHQFSLKLFCLGSPIGSSLLNASLWSAHQTHPILWYFSCPLWRLPDVLIISTPFWSF